MTPSTSLGALGAPFMGLAMLLSPPADPAPAAPPTSRGAEARASVYVRNDSDRTTVVSPRVRYRQELRTPRRVLDVTYSLDAWSSASVDIRSAATPTVREVRHEGDVGYRETLGLGGVSVGYRLSHEPDYLSNALRLAVDRDLLQRTITLGARVFGSIDRVGRAGDRHFRELLLSGGAHLSAAFVVTRSTIALIAYELRGLSGYQASPYRFVALGVAGPCSLAADLCVAEEVPRLRARHAIVGRLRQALGERVAIGGLYRFYSDSWALRSHTAAVDVTVTPARGALLGLEYRAYAQSSAWFYRARYELGDGLRFYTRDRELSSLGNHRLALRGGYEHHLRRGRVDVGALIAGSRFEYDDFVGLTEVYALDLSVSVGAAF